MKTDEITLGFTRSGVHPDNVYAYQKILSDRKIKVFGICEDMKEKSGYDKGVKAYCLEEWLSNNWDDLDEGRLAEYQDEYIEWNLWEIYYTDRYARFKYVYHDAVKLLVGMISFWEFIIEDSNITYIISDCIIGANNFIGMIVGRKRGVLYISIQTARYKNYHTYFSLDEGYVNIEHEYMKQNGYIPNKNRLSNAKKYVEEYIKNRSKPAYIESAANRSKNLKKTLLIYVKSIKRISYLWDKQFENKYNIHLYKNKKQKFYPLIEALRRPLIRKYFNDPIFEEDYILFPLHFQPEASTCVYARKYENQFFFIEQLAKSIPAGKILYVKEHSVRQGHRPISFYKEILKFPNVKLISPDADSHELIRHASFLVCLTSTMGFEALMYGKTVFVYGDCFYENFSGACRLHDVFDEKEKLLHPPQQDRDLYLDQMACYLETIHYCTLQEEPLHEETAERLYQIQEASIEELMKFIDGLEEKYVQ